MGLLWSTDQRTHRQLDVLQRGIPIVAKQYGAKAEVRLWGKKVDLKFSEDVTDEQRLECYARIEHMLRHVGLLTNNN